MNRGGQIFFVHNRVNDIETLAAKLQQIVPEARIGIGHGQMPEGELEKVMLDFVDHRFDMLLATTIVESGLDIPNANTIFIDEADRYGLADLHQLRGRVGRYKHRAYCYLLVDPGKYVSRTAAKRLRAIEEFSDMGAGFAIAMRDLELRGAGNILGTQQSGHIAAVGYELYCELLEQAVRRLKKLPPEGSSTSTSICRARPIIPRHVCARHAAEDRSLSPAGPRGDGGRAWPTWKRRWSIASAPPPHRSAAWLGLAELRIAAADWQIDAIRREEGFVVFDYGDRRRIEQLAAGRTGPAADRRRSQRLSAAGERSCRFQGNFGRGQIGVAAGLSCRL